MPWDHCDVEFILDDETCPACGFTKEQWTVQVNQTRQLRVTRRRVVRWSQVLARVGDVVELIVEPVKLDASARPSFRVYEHDQDGQHDLVAELRGRVRGKRAEARWAVPWVQDDDDVWDRRYDLAGRRAPELFFEVDLLRKTLRSGLTAEELLRVQVDLDEVLLDAQGAPLTGVPFEVQLADGATVEGVTDHRGQVRFDDVAGGATP